MTLLLVLLLLKDVEAELVMEGVEVERSLGASLAVTATASWWWDNGDSRMRWPPPPPPPSPPPPWEVSSLLERSLVPTLLS